MPAPDDLRITQSTYPGWDIDGFPGTFSPDSLDDASQEISDIVDSAQDDGSLDIPDSSDLQDAIDQSLEDLPPPDYGPPKTPTAPTCTPLPAAILVQWDGGDDGSDDSGDLDPLDWDHMAVYASTTDGFAPDDTANLVGTFSSKPGFIGMFTYPTQDYFTDTFFVFVAVCLSGQVSDPSTQSAGCRPLQIGTIDIADFAVSVTKFRDDKHHLY